VPPGEQPVDETAASRSVVGWGARVGPSAVPGRVQSDRFSKMPAAPMPEPMHMVTMP
jgi:hypothetical protein